MTDYEKYLGGLRKKYGAECGCREQRGKIPEESCNEEEIERLINRMAIAGVSEG